MELYSRRKEEPVIENTEGGGWIIKTERRKIVEKDEEIKIPEKVKRKKG